MERFKLWLGSGNVLYASCTVDGCDKRFDFPFERGTIDGGHLELTLNDHDCLRDN